MRKFFEFLANFDWITPSIGLIEDLINDPTPLQSNSWTFFIPYDSAINAGWDGASIKKLLNQHGVKTGIGQITNGEYFFSVPLKQAHWAEYILSSRGVPLTPGSSEAPGVKQ